MKQRPILFSGPMVRALLDGSKTQTRRVAKAKHLSWIEGSVLNFLDGKWNQRPLPYGKTGDQLWVREGWRTFMELDKVAPKNIPAGTSVWYDAQDDVPFHPSCFGKGRPSIHMPRWASRITLEITGVRVERLHDITRGDAMAEGCPFPNMADGDDPRKWYSDLWNSINGTDSWDLNPWVWVIEFKAVKP